ncbi:Recombination endonuclease VII [uncultured Caudovirales phage]|uniref:Recombination endonuclease VII n=1 Tax=uncultured Caudovirales phage TaxID=2100421 RepID=A0A6J7WRE8_9CAUD|nr:Recombination endonuclease VII [uncultured Caudovirales phage]
MWTQEAKQAASERAIARWANPEYKIKQSESIKRSPCCPRCGETNISNFYTDEKGRRTNKSCKQCHKDACKARWHSRDWLDKWASRNYKYNVSKEFLIALYKKQEGKCVICNQEPSTARGLHIDHCHETGEVRGLLCHGCNTGIGHLKENEKILLNAIKYLRK